MGKKDKAVTDSGFDAAPAAPAPARLTPIDIQQKEFRVSRFGGYKMRDVDEFLDQITDTFTSLTSEIERLRASGQGPVVGSPDLDDVSRQADEIIARARAEATRITAEARVGTGSTGGDGASAEQGGVNEFIARERAFLQSLAGLVQEHAETVKGMAKASRAAKATAAPPESIEAERRTEPTEPPEPRTEPDRRAEPAAAAPAVAEAQRREPPAPPVVIEAEPPADDVAADPSADRNDEPTVRIEEPANASAARSDTETEGDRSLRDLFWGED